MAGPWIFSVADGMGGHACGEVASSLAVRALAAAAGDGPPSVQEVLAAIARANQAIADRAAVSSECLGMGTTLAGVAVCAPGRGETSEQLLVFHVGDARVYRFRDDRLEPLTHDHSVVQELLDAGRISRQEAAHHPERNAVTRALGLVPDVEAAWVLEAPRVGDRYLICSDGLTREVDSDRIGDQLRSAGEPPGVARSLLDAALDAGARDNVSAIVVDVTASVASSWPQDEAGEQTQPRRSGDTVAAG